MPASQQHVTSSTPMGANLVMAAPLSVSGRRGRARSTCAGNSTGGSETSPRCWSRTATVGGRGSSPRRTKASGTSSSSSERAKTTKASSATPMPGISPEHGRTRASCAPPSSRGRTGAGGRRISAISSSTSSTSAPGTGLDRDRRVATFLDVLDRIEYLADLGVNAIEPLPVVEYSTPRSMGYNGSDLFSPEMDYEVADASSTRISHAPIAFSAAKENPR